MPLAKILDDPLIDEAAVNVYRAAPLRIGVLVVAIPLLLGALGVTTGLLVLASVFTGECIAWLVTRQFLIPHPGTKRMRFIFLAETVILAFAWLALGVTCWLSGDLYLQIAAVAIWGGQFQYSNSINHSSGAALISGIIPLAITAIGLPLLYPVGSHATALFATGCICLSFAYALETSRLAYRRRGLLHSATCELERQNVAAEAANHAKSAFLAAMSHEIRTPLNGVLGMAQSLQSDPLPAEQKEKVDIILDSSQTLMTLLNDVLDLSKIEAGKLDVVRTTVDLRELVSRVHQLFQPTAEDKGISFTYRVDDGVPQSVACDPVRVRQCLGNLVSNAIKFTPVGEVNVRLSSEMGGDGEARIAISVQDTGVGMSGASRAALFTEFTQGEQTTAQRFGGTGLGLAIARRLARLMSGDITVESELGKGSTFRLTFLAPVAVPAAARPGAAKSPQPTNTLRGKCILVADDNAVNRKVVKMLLKQTEVEIAEAENGLAALECLRSRPIDCVLLDMHMPVLNGEDTIRRIRTSREKWSRIPVIALTADVMSGGRAHFEAIGMDGLVGKPIDRADLLTELYRVLEKDAGRDAAAQTAAE